MCVTGKPAGPAGAGANGGAIGGEGTTGAEAAIGGGDDAIGGDDASGGEGATGGEDASGGEETGGDDAIGGRDAAIGGEEETRGDAVIGGGEEETGGDAAIGGGDEAARDGGRPGKPLGDPLGAGEPGTAPPARAARSGSSLLAGSSPVVSCVSTGDGLLGAGVGGGALTLVTRTGAALETSTEAEGACDGDFDADEIATGDGEIGGAGDVARTGTGGGAGETEAFGGGGAVTVGSSPSGSSAGRPRPNAGTPGALLAPAPSAPAFALDAAGLGTVLANRRARASWPPWLFSATVASGSKLSSTDSGRAALGAAAGSGVDGGSARGNFFPSATVGSSR